MKTIINQMNTQSETERAKIIANYPTGRYAIRNNSNEPVESFFNVIAGVGAEKETQINALWVAVDEYDTDGVWAGRSFKPAPKENIATEAY